MRGVRMKLLYLILGLLLTTNLKSSFRTTLNNADPNPFYNSKFLFEPIFDWEKDYRNGRTCEWQTQNAYLSVSPFFQTAKVGGSIKCGKEVELGDLTGRLNMIAVLPFNTLAPGYTEFLEDCSEETDIPNNGDICQCVNSASLIEIRNNMFQCISDAFPVSLAGSEPNELKSVQGLLELQCQEQLLGFFSVPMCYKKKGVRFQAGAVLTKGLGISFDFGISNIVQNGYFLDMEGSSTCNSQALCRSKTCPDNLTPLIYCLNPFNTSSVSNDQWTNVIKCIRNKLMCNLKSVAKACNINLCGYNKTSVEDIHGELFWRTAICARQDTDSEYPNWLFIPFFNLGYTLATGATKDYDQFFSVPTMNNGHNEVDFLAGFGIDFADTIEVGAEAGFAHFNCEKFGCFRMPTNEYQNGFYPYQTSVTVQPGDTWHVTIFMNARYFLEHWSFWGQYAYINHNADKITLLEPDPAFHPEILECKSPWTVQVFNAALNYDISPNSSLGIFVQIPLLRQNAYRETTALGNFTVIF